MCASHLTALSNNLMSHTGKTETWFLFLLFLNAVSIIFSCGFSGTQEPLLFLVMCLKMRMLLGSTDEYIFY